MNYLQPLNEKLNENEIVGRQVVGFGTTHGFEYPPVLQDGAGGV